MKQFFHAGAAGDVIYSLPTIKKMGGGELICGFNYHLFSSLKLLLKEVDYISAVYHTSERRLLEGWVNLDLFRHSPDVSKKHLVETHMTAQGLFPAIPADWIKVKSVSNDFVIVNRSCRHQDKLFNWKKELSFLKKQGEVVFLGHVKEHHAFERKVGEPVRYIHTDNHLEAAGYIAGAKIFTGNQSSLLAVRQALGLPYRMEKSPFHSNCTTHRYNETIINPVTNKLHFAITTLRQLL